MANEIPTGHMDNTWIQVDRTEDPSFFVRFLDASRARALEVARAHPELAFAHLDLKPGLSVLDCGCGTGDTLAIIARRVAPGEAVGGDLSLTMLEEARRRAAATGLSNLRFEPMDVLSLPVADQSFDRVLATQLLVHVPEPRQALQELCRATKSGGIIAIADMDWDTLVLACSHKELGRRFTRLFSDGIRNGLVVREYKGWLQAEGFANVHMLPQLMVFDSWEFVRDWVVAPSLRHFVATGAISAAEAELLTRDLAGRSDRQDFMAAATMYTVTAQRQPRPSNEQV